MSRTTSLLCAVLAMASVGAFSLGQHQGQGAIILGGSPAWSPASGVPPSPAKAGRGFLGDIIGGVVDGIGRVVDGINGLLDEEKKVVDDLLDEEKKVVNDLVARVAPTIDLVNKELVAALADPLQGLGSLSNAVTDALLQLFGELAKVAVPTSVSYGRAPDEEARRLGLRGERYNVTTLDGYILTLFRIQSACTLPERVVAIPSSNFNSAANFALLQEKSLAFKLAWNCYDVWALSLRGSRWGRGHVTLSDSSPEFWNSTLVDWGVYDLAAGLDFVHEATNSSRIRLIATDFSAAAFVAMNSKLGDAHQRHVPRVYMTEPVMCLKHLKSSALAGVAAVGDILKVVNQLVLHNEIVVGIPAVHNPMYLLCAEISPDLCLNFLKMVYGPSNSVSEEVIPHAFKYILDSNPMPVHSDFLQIIGKERCLSETDYGAQINLERYGTLEPPMYNFTATTSSCSFYFNQNSSVVTEKDWTRTYDLFGDNARQRFVVVEDSNLFTPWLSSDPDRLLYDQLLGHMEEDNLADGVPACPDSCRPQD